MTDMSDFTLGERYGSEDMYRDYPDLKPGSRIAFEKDGIIYTDTISEITYSSPEQAEKTIATINESVKRLLRDP